MELKIKVLLFIFRMTGVTFVLSMTTQHLPPDGYRFKDDVTPSLITCLMVSAAALSQCSDFQLCLCFSLFYLS